MKKILLALLLAALCAASHATVPEDPPQPKKELIGEKEFWNILRRGKALEIMGALMAGAPLEARTERSRTPLLWAVYKEN